jgi:hypothetical protein
MALSRNNTSGYGNISNTTQSGTIRCNSSQISTVHDEEMLKRCIKEYIYENELTEFRFSNIVEVTGLQEVAIKVLQSQGRIIDLQIKSVQRNKQYREEIRKLIKKILKCFVQDEKYLQSDQNLISFMVVKQ